jgi:hypothetical protein
MCSQISSAMQIRMAATPERLDGQGNILNLWRWAKNSTQQKCPSSNPPSKCDHQKKRLCQSPTNSVVSHRPFHDRLEKLLLVHHEPFWPNDWKVCNIRFRLVSLRFVLR